MPGLGANLLHGRIEDAGLNASAPPQQRWIDGWLVRFAAGKAKRARCINAVSPGRLPLQDKFELCQRVFDDAQLPLIVRITPMSEPAKLDSWLDAKGMRPFDDTRVMMHGDLACIPDEPVPAAVHIQRVGHAAFAQIVGQMRGTPLAQQQAHAQRLELAPVPFEAWVLRRADDAAVLACGQVAVEADMAGLYDIFTAARERNQGWAHRICVHLLRRGSSLGARVGYLQVEANNHPARSLYRRIGFDDAYAYHYRTAMPQPTG